MTSKRLFYVLTTLVVILALSTVGAGFGSDKILTSEAHRLEELKAKSQAFDALQASLNRSKSDLQRYAELNTIAKTIVPQDKDQTQTVREIVKIANDSGVTNVSSVTFPSSTLGALGAGKSAITQVTPVKGISGVYTLPITITVGQEDAITYAQLISFLQGLEQNRRTAQVSNLNLTPLEKDPNRLSFTVTINEYIKP